MKRSSLLRYVFACAIALMLLVPSIATAANTTTVQDGKEKPGFGLSEDLGHAMSRQADQVKQKIERGARSLFNREPLGFDWQTIEHIYSFLLQLPLRIPEFTQKVIEQSRLLGFVGSLLILIFFIAVIYSFLGQKRIMAHIEKKVMPLQNRVPKSIYPYILPAHRVVVAALFPLILLAAFTLINALIALDAAWFHLTGQLIKLWAIGALFISLLRELLARDLFKVTAQHGKSLFRLARLVVLYSIFGVGLYWAAEAFDLRRDVLALLRFTVSLSIVLVLFLLMLKKKAFLSLLPDLPHRSYEKFLRLIRRYYFPLIFLSLVLALMWSVGYRSLGRVLLAKIWSSGAAYLAIMVAYHLLSNALLRWHANIHKDNEAAQVVFQSVKSLLVYGVSLATILIVLNLLGLLGLLEQAMSFPVFELGKTGVTLWILLKAVLILVTFVFFSRISQAYLDHRVYPAVGIEPGLGYALNTFLKYLLLAVGFLVSLNVLGLDLRFLLVFAGAVGIGIGMGLQSMAANIISGFTLIFGGKLRKGDWIEVSGTMGVVTDIFLRATKVRTRDEIEYLIPNSEFINGTLVNFSLGSPLVRIAVPVGVSYSADPRKVEQILLAAAESEPSVSNEKPPVVRFVEFGDSSLNFQLLVWINVRTTPRRLVRSALYFTIFEELAKAGIEIPFPQRDIHIRSTVGKKPTGDLEAG